MAGPQFDQVQLYQKLGLLARGAPMPFVGGVAFLATPSPDSTHVILAIALANMNLTFARENDRFRAGYTVGITIRDGGVTVKAVEAHESVLVPSFRETSRVDESIIFQEMLTIKPGRYSLALTVRDDGSSRGGTEDVTLAVPALGTGSLGTPVSFARVSPRLTLDSLPHIVASPAASAVFGRDSVVGLYLEAYGPNAGPRLQLHVGVRTDDGRTMFTDTLSLARRTGLYSGVVYVPISRVGIGPAVVSVWQADHADTTRTPIFVGFGEELPVASYEDMLNYLRWFAPAFRLKTLRDTAPEYRAAAWANFVKERSSITGGNEALRDYFTRLAVANATFREEGMPGWMTDRGKVLLGLGEPDQRTEQPPSVGNSRGRYQIWTYQSLSIQLNFYDQTGFGRWRLTNTSEIEFQTAWRRRVQQ
jgi:GWxTD domain-containing protein